MSNLNPMELQVIQQAVRRVCRQLQKRERLGVPLPPPPPPGPRGQFRQYGDLTGAVMYALRPGPRTKKQILGELQAQAFAFGGPPRQVLDSVLYTKRFRRKGKLFWLA